MHLATKDQKDLDRGGAADPNQTPRSSRRRSAWGGAGGSRSPQISHFPAEVCGARGGRPWGAARQEGWVLAGRAEGRRQRARAGAAARSDGRPGERRHRRRPPAAPRPAALRIRQRGRPAATGASPHGQEFTRAGTALERVLSNPIRNKKFPPSPRALHKFQLFHYRSSQAF